jgi:hypothetical protein
MSDVGGALRGVGAALLAAALALYVALLGRLRRFEQRAGARPDGGPPWWFGYARDGVNLGGGVALLGAFALAGFPGAVALTLGALLALLAYVADWAAGRWQALRHAYVLVASLAIVVGLALVAWRDPVVEQVERWLAVAAPR